MTRWFPVTPDVTLGVQLESSWSVRQARSDQGRLTDKVTRQRRRPQRTRDVPDLAEQSVRVTIELERVAKDHHVRHADLIPHCLPASLA